MCVQRPEASESARVLAAPGEVAMPLRAQVDEREIQVWDLTGEQWSELKRVSRTAPGRIRMACCGGHGAAKTSRSGNPFFAHRPQAHQALACRWAGESTAHALCKLLAASGARAAGWRVRTEVAAADGSWRRRAVPARVGQGGA